MEDRGRARDREAELARFRAFAANPTVEARNALVEEFAWVSRYCARRFENRGEPLDDLVQVGLLGLVKAVDRFEPSRGTSFVTFALPTVIGEMRRHFRDATWAVRVPRRLKDLHVDIGATVEFLHSELGRPPSVEQVAEHLGIEVEEVLEGLDAGAAHRTSPLNTSGERGESDSPDAGADAGPVPAIDDPGLSLADDRVLLQEALAELPARDRRILELRFVLGLSQSEIAEWVGVSQVHVSRLLRRSLDILRERLGDENGTDVEGIDVPATR